MSGEIETTLAFDVDHYADYEPFERVAEAVITLGNREVKYVYDISHEIEDDHRLYCYSKYYLNGELVNEDTGYDWGQVKDGKVFHTSNGQELREFVEANAFADPEVSLTDEFESMVEVEEASR